MRSLIAFVVIAALCSGCYGPFNLTRKLYKWNGDIGGKWMNEFTFLGLAVLNVYTVAALADSVIFNSIEFWGGKNPVNAAGVRLERRGQAVAATDIKSGRLLGTATLENGQAVVRSPSGAVVRRVSEVSE